MAYAPLNINIYTAAFSGAIAGAGVPSGAFIVDPVTGNYAPVATVAAVFAQAVDTVWGAVGANQYNVNAIEEIATNIFTKGAGNPVTGAVTTQGNWTIVATAIVALVRAGDTKATADGIVFPSVGAVKQINRVLIVDGTNGVSVATGANGTWSAPFLTIQEAITYAVAKAWSSVQIIVAPGVYNGAVAVPVSLATVISGFDPTGNDTPTLGGNFTFTGAGFATLNFSDCFISAATIAAGLQSLSAKFVRCSIAADISGATVDVEWVQSEQSGEVSATAVLSTIWDGYSWSQTIAATPAFLDDAGYSREFRDSGHDTYDVNVVINGVAIGATGFAATAVLPYIRADDRVEVQLADPATQDFLCGVHGVNAGSVVLYVTNLSRVSTNFNDAVLLTIHHNTMSVEPVP